MSNSGLVSYTKYSPCYTQGRTHSIDTITIHCVVGQCSVETLGAVFAQKSRQASSNYGIGTDGRVGLYVNEKDRSWCSSNSANDNRAITIECASDTYHPYAVNDKVYATLIKLCADICQRNGIKKLVWSTDKNTRVNHLSGCNMTVHRDYANKACPGQFLYDRMGDIAEKVNALLDGGEPADPVEPPAVTTVKVEAEVLKRGSTGSAVRKLQILLNGLGCNCGTVDGDFGAKTDAALRLYQTGQKIEADGVAGAVTWGRLLK